MTTNEDPSPDAGLTTGMLARRLGVSPTTLRSWDRRYGLGPARRADGRHRRWTPADVAMVIEMCRLTAQGFPPAEAARAAKAHAAGPEPSPDPSSRSHVPTDTRTDSPADPRSGPSDGLSSGWSGRAPGKQPLLDGEAQRRCRGLARAAVRMDSAGVHRQIEDAILSYGLIAAWEAVITPTLRLAGRTWESSDEQYVEVEHLLSWHTSTALRHHYARFAASNEADASRPHLLACLPGEQHCLPLEALAAALAEHGRTVLMLGSSVPATALEAAVKRTGPATVALWSQTPATSDLPLARHVAALHWGIKGARARSRVLLCGPGWGTRTDAELLRPRTMNDVITLITGPSSTLDSSDTASAQGPRRPG